MIENRGMQETTLPRVKLDTYPVKSWIAFIFFFSLSAADFVSGSDVNDDLQHANNAQNKAAQSFYKGLRSLGTEATPEQIKQLQNQIMAPAQAEVAKAMTQLNDKRLNDMKESAFAVVRDKIKRAILPQFVLDRLENGRKPASSNLLGPLKLPPDEPHYSKKEEFVLDGSQIPKEITFPGKRKK
jgi:hypothetical protein